MPTIRLYCAFHFRLTHYRKAKLMSESEALAIVTCAGVWVHPPSSDHVRGVCVPGTRVYCVLLTEIHACRAPD